MPDSLGHAPFLSICWSPRATVRRIVTVDPRRHTWTLVTLATFFALLDTFATRFPLEPRVPVAAFLNLGVFGSLLAAAVLAPLGIPSLPPMAIVYRWVSGWFRGAASREELTAVLAWSLWPLVATWIVSWTVQLAMFGGALFTTGVSPASGQSTVVLLLAVAQIAGAIVGIVIMIAGIAEVNRFSVGESIAANVIATLILVVPLFIIAVIAVIVLLFVLLPNM